MAKKQKVAKKAKINPEVERLNFIIGLTRRAMEGTQGDTYEGFKAQIERLEQRISELS